MTSRFPFTSYPTGWFRVGTSSALRIGDVQSLHYFGRNLVLFRTKEGKPHLLEAHCAHLGAHLGVGGRINGNTVQCPLHGWQWNGKGVCEAIPSEHKNLPSAKMRAWPIRETNGQIMAWHDEDGGMPAWELPQLSEYGHPDWLPFRFAHRWKIRSHVQEFGENAMDMAHFPYLHDKLTTSSQSLGLEVSGPVLTHHVMQRYNAPGIAKLFRADAGGPLDVTCYGLGLILNRSMVNTRIDLRYTYAFFVTPIDEEHVEMYCILSMQKTTGWLLTRILRYLGIREGRQTIADDIPIWENKMYRPQPRLHKGDGPIMAYRHWASQFY